jgi:glutathione synthase
MKITVLVNDANDIQPSQTTAMLIAAAIEQGHSVGITGVGDLAGAPDGQPSAQVRWIEPCKTADLNSLMRSIAETPPTPAPLAKTDVLLMRTNPARDYDHAPAHSLAISLARQCQDSGVRVLNQPDGLIRAATKLYLLELPAFTRPETLVSQSRADILAFIRELNGPSVLKPIQGTRGNDVFLIHSAQDSNLNQIIDVILRQGPVMAQLCIPGAEAGDTRVVVLNGEVLQMDGQVAAIQRVPKSGDFRSNLHAGGAAQPGIVTHAMREVVAAIGPKLVRDGLFLVGLDFIGAQLVELNVFSTGGLRDAEKFTGKNFSASIIEALGTHKS